MSIFIGGAWPYANGSLHIGHIASLLPGDVIARYYRQKGEAVLYVSGSDCNGTPIAIRAKQENKEVKEIADYYHNEFVNCFEKLGFSYDIYTRTDTDFHYSVVQNLFNKLYENGLMYSKTIEQAYCEFDSQFLPDRLVEGECPNCGAHSRGDQCDNCSSILDPLDLINKKCKLCGNEPIISTTDHLYFKFHSLEPELREYFEKNKNTYQWRINASSMTERYINEGIPDRSVTRDLPNGVPVPIPGFKNKKVYVWIEAVSGYLSASKEWAEEKNQDFEEFWNESTISYYVHGKDNIPFHTIIWPSILLGLGIPSLPHRIISSEYMTLEKRKISTSQNWAVWITDLINDYHPDSIRYFFIANAPEQRDADFSWREFIYSHNSELLGAYGNLVNRTFKFVEKAYLSKIPSGNIDKEIINNVNDLYPSVGELIESGNLKGAIEIIFEYVRHMNKYFDHNKPWVTIKNQKHLCDDTIATCIYAIVNLNQLLKPFLPFSNVHVNQMLSLSLNSSTWTPLTQLPDQIVNISPLYERIDTKFIELEEQKLGIHK